MSEMQSGLLYHLKAQDYLELILTHTSSHKKVSLYVYQV